MAFRLGDLVIAGELYHSRPFSVHGRILLRGGEMPVLVELTGDPSEDLRGRSFEFEVPENDRPPTDEDRELVARFMNQQIGPTGEMTVARKVKKFGCPAEEVFIRSQLGELPPVQWRRCLYLEWFSQNGRVVLELADPKLKFLDGRNAPGAPDDFNPEGEDSTSIGRPEIVVVHPEDEIDPLAALQEAEDNDADGEDEGYGLIPEELNRELERSARRTDREIAAGSEEAAKAIEECEMLDDLIEHGKGTPVRKLLMGLRLPLPSTELSETQATQALKSAVAELAMFGVAFHICEHCSAVAAYRIFMEKICEECTVFREMRGTSLVQHFSTSDFCEQCQADPGGIDPAAP